MVLRTMLVAPRVLMNRTDSENTEFYNDTGQETAFLVVRSCLYTTHQPFHALGFAISLEPADGRQDP